MEKRLGKIEEVHFGLGGYQGAMLGLHVTLGDGGWGVGDSNKNKKVISPNQWFGEIGYTKNHDTKDLIPNEWTRIGDG